VSFGSRQLIHVKLTVMGITEEYDLGEVQKMATDSYLTKAVSQIKMGPERGKYVLDIDKCRLAAQENKERREAMGLSEPEAPKVHITEDTFQKHPPLKSIVGSTTALQESVKAGHFHVDVFVSKEKMRETLGASLPTLRLGAELQTNPFSTTISSLPSSKKEVLDALLFENDINNDALPLSAAIKGASGRYRPEHGQHYRTPRKRLLELKWKAYDEAISDFPKDQLLVVCCLASWMPQCRRAEPVLEELNGKMATERARGGASGGGGGGARASSPPFEMRKFDMSENRFLRDRHNINTLPMYLMYYGGKLAYASNVLNGYGTSADDMVAQVRTTIADAQRGSVLPEGFRFGATSDAITDKFGSTMTHTSPSIAGPS